DLDHGLCHSEFLLKRLIKCFDAVFDITPFDTRCLLMFDLRQIFWKRKHSVIGAQRNQNFAFSNLLLQQTDERTESKIQAQKLIVYFLAIRSKRVSNIISSRKPNREQVRNISLAKLFSGHSSLRKIDHIHIPVGTPLHLRRHFGRIEWMRKCSTFVPWLFR